MTTPPKRPLQEKDFIQESYRKNPFPIWLWFFIVVTVTALFWGGSSWYATTIGSEIQSSPFLQVTNRQLSVFLWQFPEYMRANSKIKTGYLTGFQYENKIGPFLANADDYAIAPPELLFLYHTWKRLISSEFDPRPIPLEEFKEFLNYSEEWKPNNWSGAPSPYINLFNTLTKENAPKNLTDLPDDVLPLEVKQAFQGWKNYFKEGDAINKLMVTNETLQNFLKAHPHYARNYWRNIIADKTPNYLRTFTFKKDHLDPKTVVPQDELTAFLRVALFNSLQ